MTIEGRSALAQHFDSAVYKAFAKAQPIDAKKIQDEFRGVRRPSAASKYAASLVRLCRENPPAVAPLPDPPPKPPAKYKPSLYAQVIDVSHVTGGNELGRAFCSQADKIETQVQLLFGQGGQDEARALARWSTWASEWEQQGVEVAGWFRGNAGGNPNVPTRTKPPQPQLGIRWWPDYENQIEIDLLAELYANGDYPGITTLGKRPGAYVPAGKSIMYQSFRESPASDQTIKNCRDYWVAAGMKVENLVAMIQNYQIENGDGTVKVPWFEPPLDQVKTAISLGIYRVSIYPLKDNISPAVVREMARLLAEAA